MKERRDFRHELAPIPDATGVYLLNLKLPTQQVTHVLQMVRAEHRKQEGIPREKMVLPPNSEKLSTGRQKTACVHVRSDRIEAGRRKQSWAVCGRLVGGTQRVQTDWTGPGDQGAQRPGSNTGSKMTLRGRDWEKERGKKHQFQKAQPGNKTVVES